MHFLRLPQLGLARFALGDIVRHHDRGGLGVELDIQGRGAGFEPARARSGLQFVFRDLDLLGGDGAPDDVVKKFRFFRRMDFSQQAVADGRDADGGLLGLRAGRFALGCDLRQAQRTERRLAGRREARIAARSARRQDLAVAAVFIDHEHQIGNGAGHRPQPRLALPQRGFGSIAHADFVGEHLIERGQIGGALDDALFEQGIGVAQLLLGPLQGSPQSVERAGQFADLVMIDGDIGAQGPRGQLPGGFDQRGDPPAQSGGAFLGNAITGNQHRPDHQGQRPSGDGARLVRGQHGGLQVRAGLPRHGVGQRDDPAAQRMDLARYGLQNVASIRGLTLLLEPFLSRLQLGEQGLQFRDPFGSAMAIRQSRTVFQQCKGRLNFIPPSRLPTHQKHRFIEIGPAVQIGERVADSADQLHRGLRERSVFLRQEDDPAAQVISGDQGDAEHPQSHQHDRQIR